MDSVFLLSTESRALFFQSTARAVGCSYICIWNYLPQPSNCLVSLGGWFHEDDDGGQSRRLFDSYRASLYSVESGCVPGLVYKQAPSYIDLVDSELMNLASAAVQRHFYQEAGIKRAVFMGCQNGEIEIGMSSSTKIDMKMIPQFFSEDFVQQFQIVDHSCHPSSSSSSLRSLSVGSPEYSSLFINKPSASFFPGIRIRDVVDTTPSEHPAQLISTTVPPHQMAMSAYSRHHNVQLPTPASDDAAIMRAMLAVISNSSAPSSSSSSPFQASQGGQTSGGRRQMTAFKPYNSILDSNNIEPEPRLLQVGQKMIKMGISMLRRINLMRAELPNIRDQSQPSSSNQLHHMISERKRREKLNQSFLALRTLLPPGSKKDKASVLSNTTNYVKALKAQISELEERNRMLEMQSAAIATDHIATDVDPKERVEVQIVESSESTSETLRIGVRVTVVADCDTIDLAICVLECLKEKGAVTLTSINAVIISPHMSPLARVLTLTLHVKASEWDEESFKGAVTGAVNGLVAALPETTNS